MITLHPAASAPPSFRLGRLTGKFHGGERRYRSHRLADYRLAQDISAGVEESFAHTGAYPLPQENQTISADKMTSRRASAKGFPCSKRDRMGHCGARSRSSRVACVMIWKRSIAERVRHNLYPRSAASNAASISAFASYR